MEAKNIKTVCVIGAGTMGEGITQSFAQAGLSVWMIGNVDKDKLAGHLAQVEANLKLFQEYGLLKEDIPTIKSRIRTALMKDLKEIAKECDFMIESIPEVLDLKKQLFAQLDSIRQDNILASNTGSLTIPAIIEGLRNPERIIGVHYFNPAHIMPLVELHYGPKTKEDIIATTQALIEKTGKKSILVKKFIPGFVVNRIQAAIGREAMYLVSEGVVSPQDLDIATKAAFGFRSACIGNFETADMIGLDTQVRVGDVIWPKLDNSTRQPQWYYDMVNRGELGIKSGKGYYDYTGRSKAEVLDELNRRLLPQLALFNKTQEKKK